MGKIYINQVLDIELDTTVDLSGASSPKISAQSHDGEVREWPATVDGTLLKYTTIKNVDLNKSGSWKLQAIPNVVGAEAPGETVPMKIYQLWQ